MSDLKITDTMKKRYVTPRMKARELELEENSMQITVGSNPNGEGGGKDKYDDLVNKDFGFDDDDNPWGKNSN